MRAALVLFLLALVGCSVQQALLTEARADWDDAGIDSYHIVYEVRNLNGMGGSPGDGRFDVTLVDGSVTECEVTGAPREEDGSCIGRVSDPVWRLFNYAESFDGAHTNLRLSEEWPIPVLIEYDEPDSADEEYRIKVHLFEVPGG